jgi:hypothetical protein
MMSLMARRRVQSTSRGDDTVASLTQEREANTNSWDHEESSENALETTLDMSKVLQVKRWEVQEGPFRGFNSPPGRF